MAFLVGFLRDLSLKRGLEAEPPIRDYISVVIKTDAKTQQRRKRFLFTRCGISSRSEMKSMARCERMQAAIISREMEARLVLLRRPAGSTAGHEGTRTRGAPHAGQASGRHPDAFGDVVHQHEQRERHAISGFPPAPTDGQALGQVMQLRADE